MGTEPGVRRPNHGSIPRLNNHSHLLIHEREREHSDPESAGVSCKQVISINLALREEQLARRVTASASSSRDPGHTLPRLGARPPESGNSDPPLGYTSFALRGHRFRVRFVILMTSEGLQSYLRTDSPSCPERINIAFARPVVDREIENQGRGKVRSGQMSSGRRWGAFF